MLVKGTLLQQKRIFKQIFHSIWWRHFPSCGNRFLLFNLFFLQVEPSLKLVEANLFEKDFVSVERIFHSVETVFF